MIGGYFKDVEDKLLNVVQLSRNSEKTIASRDLLEATIKQQCKLFDPIDFTHAIDKRRRKTYSNVVYATLLLILSLAVIAPPGAETRNNKVSTLQYLLCAGSTV